MDDATLVEQAVGGDRQAFGAIYDRYAPRIYDFLRSLLRDPDEAADALQDTFLVAGARLHQLRDPAKLRPWLYAIARHRGLRTIERRGRHRPLDDIEMTEADPGPDPADVAAEAADADSDGGLAALVAAAAAGLGRRDQVVLDLHLRQGLEGQELGDAIGVSASHAYVLVSRLRDQVERSLGALLVARQGREDCAQLALVLDGWDGRFTPVWRKRVARHADGCEACSDRRRRLLSPAGLLGVSPAFALPAGLRDRVLSDLELCRHSGPAWTGGGGDGGGFPPPLTGAVRRRPAALLAAAVGVLLLLGGGAYSVGRVLRDDRSTTPVVAVGATTTTTATATAPTTTTLDPSAPGSTLPPLVVDPPGGSATPLIPRPTTTSPPTTVPEPATTTVPSDTTPPTLTNPVANPATIRAVTPCVIGVPRATTVSVRATDPSEIASVVLDVGGPAPFTVAMDPVGNAGYQAAVGPIPGTPGVQFTTVPLTATVTDRAGNVATRTGSFVLQCVPPVGGP